MPKSMSPVLLLRDPQVALEAATKQYVDNGRTNGSILGASDYDNTTAPSENQAIIWVPSGAKFAPRTITPAMIGAAASTDARLSDARPPLAHSHDAGDISAGVLAPAQVPLVASPPYTITYAATITINAALGNNVKITATGNLTLAVPTNPSDGQMLMVAVLASGAARTITTATGIQLTTGIAATNVGASGKVSFYGLRYSQLSGNWTLLAQTTEL